jgi:hypothetical protein
MTVAPSTGSANAITKLEAARRQLDEAIRLWLDSREPLAVHTLTMAAFRVLYDLIAINEPEYSSHLKQLLSAHGFTRFYKIANALKHADRDPASAVSLPDDRENEWRIGLALVAYRVLADDLTPEMGGFHMMSLSTYPEHFKVAEDDDPDIEAGAQYAAKLTREDVSQRRLITGVYVDCIRKGVLPTNINIKRRYHTD